ncbi:ead/Ea22-like family protein [Klebsiella pneumoniae]
MTDITELALLISKAKASVFTLEYISQFEPADIDSDDVDLRLEVGGRDTGTNVSIVDECGQAAKVIGALVEALEKAQQRIDELENDEVRQRLANAEHQLYMAELAKNNLRASRKAQFRKRKAAEQRIAYQREYYEGVIADGGKRIAELESRTVKLPKPHAHLIWIQAGHAPDDYWDDVAVSHSEKDRCCDGSERYPVYARREIEEMLAAAGIKVEAE